MREGLISINKPHTDNIFIHKKKRIEWRKKPLPLTTHHCYETKNKGGCGKVIGKFDVVQNIEFDPLNHHLYSPDLIEDGCVPIEDLIEYAKGDVIWGNVLENIERYDKPRELNEFEKPHDFLDQSYRKRNSFFKGITRPPQSWCYVERSEKNG